MRYWMLNEGRVEGPLRKDELPGVEGFSGDSLLCPESYREDGSSQWMRAALIPELRELLPPDYHLATPGGGRRPGWLPPEPTPEDAASARSLETRLRQLERLLASAVRKLRTRDIDTLRLKSEVSRRDETIDRLHKTVAGLVSRLNTLAGLQEELGAVHDRIAGRESALPRFARELHKLQKDASAGVDETVRQACEALAQARRRVGEALAAAEEAMKRAEAAARTRRRPSRPAAKGPRKARKSRKSPKPPRPPRPGDLGLPEATVIDDLSDLGL